MVSGKQYESLISSSPNTVDSLESGNADNEIRGETTTDQMTSINDDIAQFHGIYAQ